MTRSLWKDVVVSRCSPTFVLYFRFSSLNEVSKSETNSVAERQPDQTLRLVAKSLIPSPSLRLIILVHVQ